MSTSGLASLAQEEPITQLARPQSVFVVCIAHGDGGGCYCGDGNYAAAGVRIDVEHEPECTCRTSHFCQVTSSAWNAKLRMGNASSAPMAMLPRVGSSANLLAAAVGVIPGVKKRVVMITAKIVR